MICVYGGAGSWPMGAKAYLSLNFGLSENCPKIFLLKTFVQMCKI